MRGRVVRFRPFGMCPVLVLDVSHVAAIEIGEPPSLRDDFFNFWQIGRLEMKALQALGRRPRQAGGKTALSAHPRTPHTYTAPLSFLMPAYYM